jgi:hypothetical protein
MPAKLPEHLIESPDEYLKDMPIGETWYFGFMDMRVDAEGNCYLERMAKRRQPGVFSRIKVRREVDGYHVTIEDSAIRYKPGMLRITPTCFQSCP